MSDFKGQATLSKKRYNDLLQDFETYLDSDTLLRVIQTIKNVMRFDPDANTYSMIKDKLNLKKEEGISTYVALNQRKYYERNKEVLNKKRYQKQKEKCKNT